MSPELETLDQLLGGDMPLRVLRGVYPDQSSFERGISGLLVGGDVVLTSADGTETPPWKWKQILVSIGSLQAYRLSLTEQGRRRIT